MKPRLVSVDGKLLETSDVLVEKVAAAIAFIEGTPPDVVRAAMALRQAKREAAHASLLARGHEQLRAADEAAEELYRLRDPSRWVGELGKLDPPVRDVVRRVVADRLTWDASSAFIGPREFEKQLSPVH